MKTLTPLEIKYEIEKAGSSQAAIARAKHVTPQMVHLVIFKGAVSAPVMGEISRVIGRPVDEIWPEYYKKAS